MRSWEQKEEEVATEGQAASLDEFYEAEDDFQFAQALVASLDSQAVSGAGGAAQACGHLTGAQLGVVEALH